jgi:hypothetical protein
MASPQRCGRPITVTIEHETYDILRALAQSGHSYGKIISLLLRQEEYRRQEARKLRQEWAKSTPEPLAAEVNRAGG